MIELLWKLYLFCTYDKKRSSLRAITIINLNVINIKELRVKVPIQFTRFITFLHGATLWKVLRLLHFQRDYTNTLIVPKIFNCVVQYRININNKIEINSEQGAECIIPRILETCNIKIYSMYHIAKQL